jgi:thiosulfate reductase cytochrome b subunit
VVVRNAARGGESKRGVHPWAIRLAHWANVVLLVVMAGSGLRILGAFPSFGPRGQPAPWYPWHGVPPPDALAIGGWLAGARHWHFAFGWLFIANGVAYLAYLFGSGEHRERLFFPRRDARGALQMLAYYLRLPGRLRREPPAAGLYNPLQRLAYSSALGLALLSVLTGLVLYKPVQLPRLHALFFGYDTARALHFASLIALAFFTLVHLVLVAIHWRTLRAMITGGGGG